MKQLRVGFDDQVFQAQRRGGFSKYLVEVIRRLPDYGIEPVILASSTRNLHLSESGLVQKAPSQGRLRERVEWATWRLFGHPRAQPSTLPQLDVLHHTFTHGSYLRGYSIPTVTTVVDMTPELYPELFKLGNPHFAKRKFVAKSDAVVAISENTARDMARLYGQETLSKVTVIHLGVGSEFLDGRRNDELDLPNRYALFVGVRSGYKDFTTAVKTISAVKRTAEHSGLEFVIAGGGPLSTAEVSLLKENGLDGQFQHLSPPDAAMPELYRRAEVFLFPSQYEGFGIPTLEALAVGTPTVLADASCSREVGGDLALYAPVSDVEAMVTVTLKALTRDQQARVRKSGADYARGFTWDKTAAKHAELYRSLALPL